MKHGPGKFEACGNYSLVAGYLYNYADEDIGSSDELGWYGRFSGKLKGRGPFHAIVNENSNGFVGVEWFDTEKELETAWLEIENEYLNFDSENEDA